MRLKLFNRIPYLWALIFAIALAVTQLLEHTQFLFALCTALFILVATTAFNIADGLTTLPGVYIFINAVLTCILGITVKAVLGQPGESNLSIGVETIELELLGMAGMLVAVVVEKAFRVHQPILPRYLPLPSIRAVAFGCAFVGLIGEVVSQTASASQAGGPLAFFRQLNYFIPLGIILSTIDTVRRSQGQRSLSLLTVALMLVSLAEGCIGFSKQAFFTGPLAWLLALCTAGYRLKIRDMILIGGIGFVLAQYAVPYSQFGRNLKVEGSSAQNIPLAVYLLTHFEVIQNGYDESIRNIEDQSSDYYAPWHLGILERLTMLPPDNSLIAFTDQQGVYGFQPLIVSIENLVPHVIWKNKPAAFFGNEYARAMGGIGEEDETTGISFNITADAYHQGALLGVLVVEPLVMMVIFLLFSFVLGGTREHPVNLVMALALAHLAPEGALWQTVSVVTVIVVCILLAMVCRYILAPFGSIFDPKTPAGGLANA